MQVKDAKFGFRGADNLVDGGDEGTFTDMAVRGPGIKIEERFFGFVIADDEWNFFVVAERDEVI